MTAPYSADSIRWALNRAEERGSVVSYFVSRPNGRRRWTIEHHGGTVTVSTREAWVFVQGIATERDNGGNADPLRAWLRNEHAGAGEEDPYP